MNNIKEDWIDPNVQAVSDKMKARMEFGYEKYQTTTFDSGLNFHQFATHLEEELMDSLVYIQSLRQRQSEINTIPDALQVLKLSMKDDMDYAWAWQCNIAMAMVDAGCDHKVANIGAATSIARLFGVDVTSSKYYQDIINKVEK